MPSKACPHPERLTGNELRFSSRLRFRRHSRESGNPGAQGKSLISGQQQPVDKAQQLPWTPAFAGVTITRGFHYIHFVSGSEEPAKGRLEGRRAYRQAKLSTTVGGNRTV